MKITEFKMSIRIPPSTHWSEPIQYNTLIGVVTKCFLKNNDTNDKYKCELYGTCVNMHHETQSILINGSIKIKTENTVLFFPSGMVPIMTTRNTRYFKTINQNESNEILNKQDIERLLIYCFNKKVNCLINGFFSKTNYNGKTTVRMNIYKIKFYLCWTDEICKLCGKHNSDTICKYSCQSSQRISSYSSSVIS
jgi:hypothetical protein